MADWAGSEECYADYLARTYGLGERAGSPDNSTYATTSVATQEHAPPAPVGPASRPLTAAQRLSRNRAIKRASSDVIMINHLSTMYHMNRRIYEMYSRTDGSGAGGTGSRARDGRAGSRPTTAPVGGRPASAPPRQQHGRQQQGGKLPLPQQVPEPWEAEAQAAVAAVQEAPAAVQVPASQQAPPSFVKRHVQNSKAALKAAILDEIVEHRIYEGARLRALFRSYLKLNSGEAFFPALAAVIEELRTELGVA